MKEEEKNISEKPKEKEPLPTGHSNFKQFTLFIFMLLVTVICLIFYIKQTAREQSKTLVKNLEIYAMQQNKLLSEEQHQQQESLRNINSKVQQIETLMKKELADKNYKTDNWLMLKARYYLELAKINNNWTNDLASTLELLENADYVLKSIDSDEITDVRKLIAEEQLAVRQAQKIDTVKITSNIGAIERDIDSWSVKPPAAPDLQSDKPQQSEQKQTNWRDNLKANMQKLNGLVIIKKISDSPQYIITPSYIAALKQNIKINLQHMQWAVIERNQAIYTSSCDQAIANIKGGFDPKESYVSAAIEQLNSLKSVSLSYSKPKLGKSLETLNTFIDKQTNTQQG